MSGPKFTQRMTMHLNGGSEFSELQFDVFADGEPTGIRHFRETNGSPKYLITRDIFVCGEDTFDVMATKGVGLQEWLLAHAPPALFVPAEEGATDPREAMP